MRLPLWRIVHRGFFLTPATAPVAASNPAHAAQIRCSASWANSRRPMSPIHRKRAGVTISTRRTGSTTWLSIAKQFLRGEPFAATHVKMQYGMPIGHVHTIAMICRFYYFTCKFCTLSAKHKGAECFKANKIAFSPLYSWTSNTVILNIVSS